MIKTGEWKYEEIKSVILAILEMMASYKNDDDAFVTFSEGLRQLSILQEVDLFHCIMADGEIIRELRNVLDESPY